MHIYIERDIRVHTVSIYKYMHTYIYIHTCAHLFVCGVEAEHAEDAVAQAEEEERVGEGDRREDAHASDHSESVARRLRIPEGGGLDQIGYRRGGLDQVRD